MKSVKFWIQEFTKQLDRKLRTTKVDPLPDWVLEKIYSRPERDEPGLARWVKAQAIEGRD